MDKSLIRVRSILANHGVIELHDTTNALIEKFGFDGAECYLQAQLYILRDIRETTESSGDENVLYD